MILLCHVGPLDRRVIEALPPPVAIVDIDPTDGTAYARHLGLAWAMALNNGDELVTIEHDIVVHDLVFRAFAECESPACAFAYWNGAGYVPGLGCTRFRAELLADYPELMAEAAALDDDLMAAGDWRRMDTRIYRRLEANGIRPCIHMPPVTHLHEYPIPAPHEARA